MTNGYPSLSPVTVARSDCDYADFRIYEVSSSRTLGVSRRRLFHRLLCLDVNLLRVSSDTMLRLRAQ
ncbi:uncharacterized protein B0H18DRAFT_982800 [Fomitopsis serialis]|uniref:uncharacterized protein n=1 Tax=Fomitopsis serialis TaxID=139415 RepID=UPI002007AC6D|nr:uncharacterized protein B0H18DRAFT_982800 [Neoantrodia serialis]KAH9933928.1 hypothetical protein B0H18DRAFT_982800 [Neoantrodia serialis]